MKVARTFVYVIGRVEGERLVGPIKIGLTKSMAGRLATLQTGAPHKLELLAHIIMPSRELALVLERTMHGMLARHALHGEWFDVDPVQAIGLIADLTKKIFEQVGIEKPDLYDALDKVGATACRKFFVQEHRKAQQ